MSERTMRRNEGIDGAASRRFRLVGAAHLGLAAITNVVTGWALLYLGTTNQLVRWAFTDLDTYVSAQLVVREADLVVAVATTGALVAGAALVLVGAATIPVVHRVVYDRRPAWWGPAGVASAVNPLAAPLACVAIVLLWLERRMQKEGRLPAVLS